jgi:hypothetical protein
MDVRIFRNLTFKCYSIQMRVDGAWRTVAHAESAEIRNARFHVSEAGRKRVLETGKKTIHAWLQGGLEAWQGAIRPAGSAAGLEAFQRDFLQPAAPRAVAYNPRRDGSFIWRDNGAPISRASYARLDNRGVFAIA